MQIHFSSSFLILLIGEKSTPFSPQAPFPPPPPPPPPLPAKKGCAKKGHCESHVRKGRKSRVGDLRETGRGKWGGAEKGNGGSKIAAHSFWVGELVLHVVEQ